MEGYLQVVVCVGESSSHLPFIEVRSRYWVFHFRVFMISSHLNDGEILYISRNHYRWTLFQRKKNYISISKKCWKKLYFDRLFSIFFEIIPTSENIREFCIQNYINYEIKYYFEWKICSLVIHRCDEGSCEFACWYSRETNSVEWWVMMIF